VFEKPLAPRAAGVAVAVGLAIAIVFASGAQPGYDTSWHIVWAQQILGGTAPTFDTWAAPTEHPLLMLIALAAALFGSAAPQVMLIFTLLALFGLLEAMRQLGREVFGSGLAGVIAWVLMAGAYGLLLQALRGYLDVCFLLLVTLAALRVAREDRPTAGWLPLLLAGLLRPEAWLLAGIAAAVGWRDSNRDSRMKSLAAVFAPPIIWFALDALVTGQPLLSLKTASALEVVASGGPLHVFAGSLGGGLRGPATLLGLVGIAAAWKLIGLKRVQLPLVLIGAGIAMALVIAIGGLTLLPRYLLLCDLGLAMFAGYALGGWAGESGTALWRGVGLVAIVAGVTGAIVLGAPEKLAGEVRLDASVHADLVRLFKVERVQRAMDRCGEGVMPEPGKVTFPSFRLLPDARLITRDVIPPYPYNSVTVFGRAELDARKSRVSITIKPARTDKRILDRYSHPGIDLPVNEGVPNGFVQFASSGPFIAWTNCPAVMGKRLSR